MKLGVLLLSGIFVSGLWAAANAGVAQVKSVYLLPMGNSFEQYLANRITNAGVFEVVADPKKADAVFTDRLGAGFERRLDDLAGPVADTEAKPPAEQTKKEDEKAAESTAGGMGDTRATGAVPATGFGRSRGTVFLVDVKSRRVLWSTFNRPKDTTSRGLDQAAVRVVKELADALTPMKK